MVGNPKWRRGAGRYHSYYHYGYSGGWVYAGKVPAEAFYGDKLIATGTLYECQKAIENEWHKRHLKPRGK